MSEELKPCPFCGGSNILVLQHPQTKAAWCRCDGCASESGSALEIYTKKEAVSFWNTRADDTAALKAAVVEAQLFMALLKSSKNDEHLPIEKIIGMSEVYLQKHAVAIKAAGEKT